MNRSYSFIFFSVFTENWPILLKLIGEETFRRGLQQWIKSIALISQDKNIKWNDQNQISYSKIEMMIKNGPRKKMLVSTGIYCGDSHSPP